jgi:hypothetical protein
MENAQIVLFELQRTTFHVWALTVSLENSVCRKNHLKTTLYPLLQILGVTDFYFL